MRPHSRERAHLDRRRQRQHDASHDEWPECGSCQLIMGQSIPEANVTMTYGSYHYDPSSLTFYPQIPPVAPDSYDLAQATLTQGNTTFFAKVFGITAFNVSATAIAAHRPRDVCIVLDYSGSMNNESDLWNCESYQGSNQGTSNNTDPVFPQWGYYNTTFSPLCRLQCTSSSDLVGYCNITQSVGGSGPMVNDYYQNARGAANATPAFAPATHLAGRQQCAAPSRFPPHSRAAIRPRPP